MARIVALLFAVAVALAATAAMAAEENNFPGTVNCFITGAAPEKPRSLSFCYKFNDNACCAPASDDETKGFFDSMFDLGLSCRLRGDVRKHPMAKFYCLGCDPQQPKYIRNEPYIPFCEGDSCVTQLYRFYPGDLYDDTHDPSNPITPVTDDKLNALKNADLVTPSGATLSPFDARRQTLLICREWAEKEFGVPNTDGYMSKFTRCGLLKSSPCLDISGDVIPNRDRYLCGDDLILPASAYDNLEKFFNDIQMGPTGLSDTFGYVLVQNRQCDASDFTPGTTAVEGGNRANGEFDNFNPNCLRTVDQIKTNGVSAWSQAFNATANRLSEAYLEPNTDELCFNSAASVAPYAALLILSLIAALFTL